MAIKGMAQVRRNINRTLKNVIPENATKAMHITTSIIGGYATLMTPVEYGVLRNSQYRTVRTINGKVVAAIGYTAKYAAAVHEKSGKLKGRPRPSGKGNYWSPAAEPEFLTKAGDRHVDEIDAAVLREMKV